MSKLTLDEIIGVRDDCAQWLIAHINGAESNTDGQLEDLMIRSVFDPDLGRQSLENVITFGVGFPDGNSFVDPIFKELVALEENTGLSVTGVHFSRGLWGDNENEVDYVNIQLDLTAC